LVFVCDKIPNFNVLQIFANKFVSIYFHENGKPKFAVSFETLVFGCLRWKLSGEIKSQLPKDAMFYVPLGVGSPGD
jgi:hypothetical protein